MLRSCIATRTVSVFVAGRGPLSVALAINAIPCVPVDAQPAGMLTVAAAARVDWVPNALALPGPFPTCGIADEAPWPEHDAVKRPTASAAAVNLFIR